MTKNYKVGDRVRVKTFKVRPYYWNTLGHMDHLMGEVVTVQKILPSGTLVIYDGDYAWLIKAEDVEPVKNECIVIYRKENKVIALDKTTGKKAEARCNPDDTFDFYTGAKLAFDRLATHEKKLLNARICVTKGDVNFTKGKIYEVKDGRVTDDDGFKFPAQHIEIMSIEDLHEYFSHGGAYSPNGLEFVEVIE